MLDPKCLWQSALENLRTNGDMDGDNASISVYHTGGQAQPMGMKISVYPQQGGHRDEGIHADVADHTPVGDEEIYAS
eukprot:m.22127 g.22127  ORF g.22127 m.22127 type:complete len:77 (+) comp12636_c0_seq2:701-931(+)